jgi:hypothetical protein
MTPLSRCSNETHHIKILRGGRIKQTAGAPDVHDVVGEAEAVAPLRKTKIKVPVYQAEVDHVGVLLDL